MGRRRTWRDRAKRRWPGLAVGLVVAIGAAGNADLGDPPRFDGAGYAMLGRSILEGHGYRNIDHPDAPPHHHFPPGYPALLAAVWAVTGPSSRSAHVLSLCCTTGAAVAAWAWFRRQYPARVAALMGLALAMNWTWHRAGAAIQSEPPYMFIKQIALLAAIGAAARGGIGRGARVGALLGALTLTRHVGVSIVAAIGAELAIRRRWRALAAMAAVAGAIVAPWAYRLATAERPTQLGLLPGRGIAEVVAGNLRFYALRTPDALVGPVVEVGTVFAPRAYPLAVAAAAVGTGVLVWGLRIAMRTPRLRTASLVVACNLGLLLVWPFTEAGRFLVPLVPALLVLAVEGLASLLRRFGRRRSRDWAAALLLLAATPYSLYAIAADRDGSGRAPGSGIDAACRWIADHGDRDGPVLTDYPAEVFWQTDRAGLVPADDPEAIAAQIGRRGVAYLLVARDRYAGAPDGPLARFVDAGPGRVRRAWKDEGGRVEVFEVGGGE